MGRGRGRIFIGMMVVLILSFVTGALANSAQLLSGPRYGRDLYANAHFTDVGNHWARDDIFRLASLSVVRGYGANQFRPEQTMSGQEAISLILRQRGLEEEAQRLGMEQGIPGQATVDAWAEGYLQLAVGEGLITDGERYSKNWRGGVERQDVVVWMAKSLGLTPVYGANQQSVFTFNDWRQIAGENLPYIEAALQRGLISGDQRGNFAPQRAMKRGEVVSLLSRVDDDLLANRNLNLYRGVVQNITSSQQVNNGKTVVTSKYIIKNEEGSGTQILAEAGLGQQDRQFPVLKKGRLGLASLMQVGDWIRYIVDENNQVVFVEVESQTTQQIEGMIQSLSLSDQTVTVHLYGGGLVTYPIALSATVTVNQRPAEVRDLLYEQDVVVTVVNGEVTSIGASLEGTSQGYISPDRRVVTGTVRSIWGDRMTVVLPDSRVQEVVVSSSTPIAKEGRQIRLSQIATGDQVKLYFDEIHTNRVNRVEVAGGEVNLANLYRGEIGRVDWNGGNLTLQSFEQYRHGRWASGGGQQFIEIDGTAKIYVGHQRISLQDLANRFRGSQAYLATSDPFGREKVVHVQLYNGYQQDQYGKLQSYDWLGGRFRVDHQPVSFGPGTIIVREGRLIDGHGLREKDDVFVAADQTYYLGERAANLVVVEGISAGKGPGFDLYRGRIEWIRNGWFELRQDYYRLTNNHWHRLSGGMLLSLHSGTRIIDTTGDDGVVVISLEEFMESQYTRKYTTYDSWSYWHYALTDGQNTLAIVITKPGYSPSSTERVSTAVVKAVHPGQKFIEVDQVKDWSEFSGRWNINTSLHEINMEGGAIVRNGQRLDLTGLRPGDPLYLVRDGSKALIVVVE